MPVRKKQCASCPFRGGASEEDIREASAVHPEHWPCHTDDLHGDEGIQCRGHWGARLRFKNRYGQVELDRITEEWSKRLNPNS